MFSSHRRVVHGLLAQLVEWTYQLHSISTRLSKATVTSISRSVAVFFEEEEEVGFSNSNLAQRQPSADDSLIGHVADVLGDT